MHSEDKLEKEKKAGNPLFILIIFVTLIGFIFYVPEIYKKYNSNIADFLGIGSKDPENKEPNPDDGKSPVSAYYQLGANSTLKFNEITLSDISLSSDKKLSFKVNTEDTFNLDEADYYIEFYRNRKTFIGRRSILGTVTKSKPFEVDLSNLDVDTTTYMVVSHISDSAIGGINSDTDESGLSDIVCTKGKETYDYEFYQKKLTKVKYKYSYNSPNMDEYANEVLKYQKIEKEYNEYRGVTSSIVDNSTSFIFLSEFDYGETTTFSKIKDHHIFTKGEYNHVIKFKMEAEGYECK